MSGQRGERRASDDDDARPEGRRERAVRARRLFALAFALTLVVGSLAAGCATEEELLFGDPARVTGGFGSSSSSGQVECDVDPECTVSWQNDIFAPILASRSDGACGASGCHDEGVGGLFFADNNPDAAYAAIKNYDLVGVGPYVVDCAPERSAIMCNIQLPSGVDNPYVGDDLPLNGPCGSPMPRIKGDSPARALRIDELNLIAEWIRCGAPQN